MPVIANADTKSISQLSVDIVDLAQRARNKKIKPSELEGGTFSISNQGGIGGVGFTPIVLWPQVAILGVSRAAVEPVAVDGQFVPRKMLPLSLSYDHRVIDGADAARFLRWVCECLEQPMTLHLD
jgi:pyruvate dehydrogenase E2 component (dihydrolipoamide acetyltransferase)